jgi:flagellar biosynthesis/type III secretory pathway chaperone
MELNRLSAELEKTLTDNLKLYDEMGKALDEECEALKAYSLTRLDAAIKRKMEVASKLRLIEEARNAMVSKISGRLGTPPAQISLKGLADQVGGEVRTRLLTLRSRMRQIVQTVTEKNDFNRGVISKLMNLNAASAANLKELINPESTYEKGGFTPVSAFKPGQVVSRTY